MGGGSITYYGSNYGTTVSNADPTRSVNIGNYKIFDGDGEIGFLPFQNVIVDVNYLFNDDLDGNGQTSQFNIQWDVLPRSRSMNCDNIKFQFDVWFPVTQKPTYDDVFGPREP